MQFTLREAVVLLVLVAVVAAVAVPTTTHQRGCGNHRNASASLKTITTAQADFRSNDRDGNLVNDFWTGDVFGLYALVPVPAGVTRLGPDTDDASNIIKLIEPSVAGADGATCLREYANVTVAASIVNGSPKAGYIYRAFADQDDGEGPAPLGRDTDGLAYYGYVHDRSRFAFMAAPESLAAGKLLFIVNADNTMYKYNLPPTYAATFTPMNTEHGSSSAIRGTGRAQLDDARCFPASPGSIGASRFD